MGETDFEYKGHRVFITLNERRGQFAWSWTTDNGRMGKCTEGGAASEALAIIEATGHAKAMLNLPASSMG